MPLVQKNWKVACPQMKPLAKSICEPAQFWLPTYALTGLLKMPSSICQFIGLWEFFTVLPVNVLPLSPLGAPNKDLGTASQTLLAEVKLRLQ